MKRILLMLMAAALVAAGCETQVITPSKKVGELKLSVSCSTDGYQDKLLVKSCASPFSINELMKPSTRSGTMMV